MRKLQFIKTYNIVENTFSLLEQYFKSCNQILSKLKTTQNILEYSNTLVDKAITVKEGDANTLVELHFKAMNIPGHTSGVTFYIINDVIFAGDTLFRIRMPFVIK